MRINAINLATMDPLNRRVVSTVLAALSAVLVLITLSNLMLGFRHYRQRLDYQEKIRSLQAAAPLHPAVEIDDKAAAALSERVRFTNRLIAQDRFPWIRVLNLLEETLPPEVVLTEIKPGTDLLHLSLAGSAAGVNELVRFQKALEASGMFDSVNLSTLSLDKSGEIDAPDTGIRFNMQGRFRMQNLFGEADAGVLEAVLAQPAGG